MKRLISRFFRIKAGFLKLMQFNVKEKKITHNFKLMKMIIKMPKKYFLEPIHKMFTIPARPSPSTYQIHCTV